MKIPLFISVVAGLAANTIGMDLAEVTEKQCRDLTPKIDMTWFASQKTFYYPLMDKLSVWFFAKDVRGSTFANEQTAKEIVKLGCNTWTLPNNTTFFGVDMLFDVVITSEEILYKRKGTENPFRRFRYDMTDNKNFVFGTNCLDNGAGGAGWILLSNTPTLSPETEKRIVRRIESLGFSRKNIVKPPNHQICKTIPAEGSIQLTDLVEQLGTEVLFLK